MSYPKPPATAGSWPDPGEWIEPTPAEPAAIKRPTATTPEPRTGNAVGDVLAAAFAKRGRK